MSVIYSITHIDTGRRYIGRASDFRLRKNRHLCDLRKGRHHCRYLQRAWDKYGEVAFSFAVIENVSPDVDIIAREQFWLDNVSDKFNGHRSASGPTGHRHSAETRGKISAALKGRIIAPEVAKKISDARRGQKIRPRYGRKVLPDTKHKIGSANSVARTLISPDGLLVAITNLSAFARENGLAKSGLSAVSLGRVPQYRGWTLAHRSHFA